MSLHRARNVVVHLCYSFHLCPVAVAWQSDKHESANFLKFCKRIFAFLAHPVGKQLAIRAGLCNLLFLPVYIAFDWRCFVFLVSLKVTF